MRFYVQRIVQSKVLKVENQGPQIKEDGKPIEFPVLAVKPSQPSTPAKYTDEQQQPFFPSLRQKPARKHDGTNMPEFIIGYVAKVRSI